MSISCHVCIALAGSDSSIAHIAAELKGAPAGSVHRPRFDIVSFPLAGAVGTLEEVIERVRTVAQGTKSASFSLNFSGLKADGNRLIAPVANSSAQAASQLRKQIVDALKLSGNVAVVRWSVGDIFFFWVAVFSCFDRCGLGVSSFLSLSTASLFLYDF
jgi:hypothetical protein